MRKKLSVFLTFTLALLISAAQADTIQLKNGSVLKGKVTSFADEQFIILLDSGEGRSKSRAMIYIGDVARIDFDSAPAMSAAIEPARNTEPTLRQPETVKPETVASDPQPREKQLEETKPRDAEAPPRDTESPPPVVKEPEPEKREPEREKTLVTDPPPAAAPEVEKPRKPTGPVRTANVDVMAKRDWTSTGMIIKRGDRIRISSAGTITLNPESGVTTGPEGIEAADNKKLMQDRPTGALIAVIGADNDDFIFVGNAIEFTSTRDGLLFLSVNEGVLSDNTGSFKASIEVQSERTVGRQ